jgi:hypothetical protein
MSPGDLDPPEPVWVCSKCRQAVPDTLDVCWNCGTTRDGIPDPTFEKSELSERNSEPESAQTPASATCAKCGSTKMIPNAQTLDHMGIALQIAVDCNPQALLLKDRRSGQLTADICGDCGHVELHVSNGPQLYEHYQRGLQRLAAAKQSKRESPG